MWELLTGEEPYADMHCGAIIGKNLVNNSLYLKGKLDSFIRHKKFWRNGAT